MKRILIAPVAAALLTGHAYADTMVSQNSSMHSFDTSDCDDRMQEGFSVTSDIYYTDHASDYYRQTKYALADGIYALQPGDKRLELYLEGKAGTQSESYRLENGYATTTVDSQMAIYMAAGVGAKYHLLDNVAVGASIVVADNVPDERSGQNVEMSLRYTF